MGSILSIRDLLRLGSAASSEGATIVCSSVSLTQFVRIGSSVSVKLRVQIGSLYNSLSSKRLFWEQLFR